MKTGLFMLTAIFSFWGYFFGYDFPAQKYMHMTIKNTIKAVEKKYPVYACGTGGSMPRRIILSLTISFSTKEKLSKEKIREVLVFAAEEMIQQVNNNKEMHPYIIEYPFSLKHVQILLFNNEKDGKDVYDPGISVGEIQDGILEYDTTSPDQKFGYKNVMTETYEEALHLLNK